MCLLKLAESKQLEGIWSYTIEKKKKFSLSIFEHQIYL